VGSWKLTRLRTTHGETTTVAATIPTRPSPTRARTDRGRASATAGTRRRSAKKASSARVSASARPSGINEVADGVFSSISFTAMLISRSSASRSTSSVFVWRTGMPV